MLCIYMYRNDFIYIGLFLCFISFCTSMFCLVCIKILYCIVLVCILFIKRKSVNLFISMTYFDCFELVRRLKFHVYAVKTSDRQYFLEMWPNFRFPFPKSSFQAQTTDNKNSETILQGFSLKKLKDSSIKTPSPSPISISWVKNLFAVWSRCKLQTHQHWSKREGETFAKSSCLKWLVIVVEFY